MLLPESRGGQLSRDERCRAASDRFIRKIVCPAALVANVSVPIEPVGCWANSSFFTASKNQQNSGGWLVGLCMLLVQLRVLWSLPRAARPR